MKKELTEEQIAKEDHDNGECVGGCKWCHEKHREFVAALIQPKSGHYALYTFRA